MGRATFQDVNTHNQHCGQRALVACGSIVSISYMFYRIIFITSRKLQEFLTGQSLIKNIVVPHKTTPQLLTYSGTHQEVSAIYQFSNPPSNLCRIPAIVPRTSTNTCDWMHQFEIPQKVKWSQRICIHHATLYLKKMCYISTFSVQSRRESNSEFILLRICE